MSVDLEALVNQCRRFGVEPHATESSVSALALLDAMPRDQRVHVQWIMGREWQLVIDTRLVYSGSLEDCATSLAARMTP